ncbi:hypothetical protein ACRAWG_36720 [Methylobacterium sp. P31]
MVPGGATRRGTGHPVSDHVLSKAADDGTLQAAIWPQSAQVVLEKTKTGAPRRVPLSDKAVATIKNLLDDPPRPHSG